MRKNLSMRKGHGNNSPYVRKVRDLRKRRKNIKIRVGELGLKDTNFLNLVKKAGGAMKESMNKTT